MSIFSKLEIKSRGKYLFYTVGKDTAVFLAVKNKNLDNSHVKIPKKIGKYIVRGISTTNSGRRKKLWENIRHKDTMKLQRALRYYTDVGFFLDCTLPDTIEYIGVLPINRYRSGKPKLHECYTLPKNVSYIEGSKIEAKTLVLPKDIKYVGNTTDFNTLERILTGNEECDAGVPHYSLSQYRDEPNDGQLFQSKIAKNAFSNHLNLKNITLPDGIEEIEDNAFYGVGKIEYFHFPKSLKKLSKSAFAGSELIQDFNYPSDFPEKLSKSNYDFKLTGKIALDASEYIDAFVQSQNSSGDHLTKFASEIDLSALKGKLPRRAFMQEEKANYIYIPDKSQKIILGNDITEIGESAFEGSTITAITLPAKLKIIGKNAFLKCPNLACLKLPDNIAVIQTGALDTECQLIISASPETLERIKDEPGYSEYYRKTAALRAEADEFIAKYNDYFDGKKTEEIPKVADLEKYWTDHGQNPKIYAKLIERLKTGVFHKEHFEALVNKAKNLGLHKEAGEFDKICKERADKSKQLSATDLPSNWLSAYRLNPDNYIAFDKILTYLIEHYEKGVEDSYLLYVNSFMLARSRKTKKHLLDYGYKSPASSYLYQFDDPFDKLYREKIGDPSAYREFERSLRFLPILTKSPEKNIINLDLDLIESCKKACDEKSPYAYLWCELAVAFSPNFKPPKCAPRPAPMENKKSTAATAGIYGFDINSFSDYSATTKAYTSPSSSSSYSYLSEEESQKGDDIIAEIKLKDDAARYVDYLMDYTPAPDDLDYLVEEFSGIDWSDFGDV